ncbi:MAG: hypothetical protein CSA22_01050 [Deltaproteobacteria bacterium]|nr:MAG: hypothetical protein CSA22_01050 [Deltaproteobacteria bacterium]
MPWSTKRLLFIMGKGGTGKTTVAAAMGLTARNAGRRVLVVELGSASRLSGLFRVDSLGDTPTPLSDHLDAVCLNPKMVLKDYIQTHLPFSIMARRINRAEWVDVIAESTPGLQEAMTLGKIWHLSEEIDKKGAYRYDLILVDTPATCDGIRLLQQPETFINRVRVGPFADQLKEVQELVSDSEKTGLVLVSLPEELPVNETLKLTRAAQTALRIPVDATVINGCYSRKFSSEEVKELRAFKDRVAAGSIRKVLKTALAQDHRYRFQHFFVNHLRKRSLGKIIELPCLFSNDLGIGELQTLAKHIVDRSPSIDNGTSEFKMV